MKREELRNMRFSVIGAARSGLAVARLLAGTGAHVFVSEASARPASEEELKRLQIPCEFDGHTARALDADVLVLSPGVPSTAQPVRDALARGMKVVSELETASWFSPGPIIAITGTNGKTTTTTLAGRMFEDAGRPAVVGGNIGTAFSDIVRSMTAEHTAILEVSSFQLDHVDAFHPFVSVLLNITQDHLDRYDHSMELYIRSKCRVFAKQTTGDMLVYNADDDLTRTAVELHAPAGVTLLPFSANATLTSGAWVADGLMTTAIAEKRTAVVPVQEISIRGVHNLYNAMAATLAAQAAGIGAASLRATLKNFKGVEHRLEHVRELDGITYVNDSKATNVDSVWYALQSFTTPAVVTRGTITRVSRSLCGNMSGRSLPSASQRTRSLRRSRRSSP
jgi:UDP-N-acetylmuramoylalanine--D-glutamate ligase